MTSVVLLAIALTMLVSCGGEREPEAPARDVLSDAGRALCRAAEVAPDDPREAERIFLDEVHGPLHQLADEIATVDRSASARLLEAKQAVEAAEGTPQVELPTLWTELVDATAVALDGLELGAPPCAE